MPSHPDRVRRNYEILEQPQLAYEEWDLILDALVYYPVFGEIKRTRAERVIAFVEHILATH